MPLEITFTLSDEDLDHFQAIANKAKTALGDSENAESIEIAARKMIEDSKSKNLPGFMDERLEKLQFVIDMVSDQEWRLSDEERKRVLGALVYFCNPEDLIPDHTPGLGFIDDAIYVEIVIRELQAEIDSYEEFCTFRAAEEKRRKETGQDPHVQREEWLTDKRAALQARMRKSRPGRGWRLRW